jgi:hypothetical protein
VAGDGVTRVGAHAGEEHLADAPVQVGPPGVRIEAGDFVWQHVGRRDGVEESQKEGKLVRERLLGVCVVGLERRRPERLTRQERIADEGSTGDGIFQADPNRDWDRQAHPRTDGAQDSDEMGEPIDAAGIAGETKHRVSIDDEDVVVLPVPLDGLDRLDGEIRVDPADSPDVLIHGVASSLDPVDIW